MPWLIMAAVLIVGIVIGVVGMRQRYKAQEVVASVNGDSITKSELFERLQAVAGQQTMRAMVGEKLTLQFAKKQGALPTEEQITARFNTELKKEPKLREKLAERGLSEAQFRESLMMATAQANVLSKGVTVTDAEARRFYDANVNKSNPNAVFYTPDSVQIAVIVTQTEARSRLANADLNKGIPWQTVVTNYSEDNSKKSAGVLPPTFRGRSRSSVIPGLENTLFKMKIGDRIGPLKIRVPVAPNQIKDSWWIIRCLDKKRESTKPYDLVKDECKTNVGVQKAGKAKVMQTQIGFKEFQKNAKTQSFWPNYREAVKISE